MEQPCAIHGRITEVHKAFPNSTLLNSDFACKWNLKFNHSKSKVLVVGQRIDKDRKWYLGNEKIDETDNYKYLGVYLSRNLKPTHLQRILKNKKFSAYLKKH
jgi:hypothetical protein